MVAVAIAAAVPTTSGPLVAVAGTAEATGSPDVVIVGDSIIAGNRRLIDPVLATAGLDVHIDAQSGRNLTESFVDRERQVDSGAAAVARLREQGLRPDLWLIELGANDVSIIRRCGCADPVTFAGARIDQLLEELPPGANVAWVTVHRDVLEPAVTHFNNALLVRSLQQIDWHAAALFRDDWLLDSKHPSVVGARAFGQVLVDGMTIYLDGPFRGERTARRLGLSSYPTGL